VNRGLIDQDAFRHARIATDDHVIAAKIQRFERQRIKRQEVTEQPIFSGQPIPLRRFDRSAGQIRRQILLTVKQREEVSPGIHCGQHVYGLLRATLGEIPGMNDRYSHEASMFAKDERRGDWPLRLLKEEKAMKLLPSAKRLE
jgi:hypothetical protein